MQIVMNVIFWCFVALVAYFAIRRVVEWLADREVLAERIRVAESSNRIVVEVSSDLAEYCWVCGAVGYEDRPLVHLPGCENLICTKCEGIGANPDRFHAWHECDACQGRGAMEC